MPRTGICLCNAISPGLYYLPQLISASKGPTESRNSCRIPFRSGARILAPLVPLDSPFSLRVAIRHAKLVKSSCGEDYTTVLQQQSSTPSRNPSTMTPHWEVRGPQRLHRTRPRARLARARLGLAEQTSPLSQSRRTGLT